jgi:hypothetical protein
MPREGVPMKNPIRLFLVLFILAFSTTLYFGFIARFEPTKNIPIEIPDGVIMVGKEP